VPHRETRALTSVSRARWLLGVPWWPTRPPILPAILGRLVGWAGHSGLVAGRDGMLDLRASEGQRPSRPAIALMLFGVGVAFSFFGKPYSQPRAAVGLDLARFLERRASLKSPGSNPLFFIVIILASLMPGPSSTRAGGCSCGLWAQCAGRAPMGISVNLVRLLTTTIGGVSCRRRRAFLSPLIRVRGTKASPRAKA